MLPLLLTAVVEERLRPEQLVALSSANAARIFSLAGKGRLEEGADADLALVSLGEPSRIDTSRWLSRSRGTARIWEGREVRGRVLATYVRGRRVWDAKAGLVGEAGWGRQVRPS